MTTPTDPTTLRTALEALVSAAWMSDEDGSCVLCGYGFDPEDHTLTDCPVNLARAVLAPPAPAADEARCGFPDCGGRRGNILHNPGVGDTLDDHPFQPAPPTAPATEPVAALVEACQWTPTTEPCLGDPDDWRHRRCLPEGDPCPDPCPAMPGCHPYTPVAARAEVDVERLVEHIGTVHGGVGCCDERTLDHVVQTIRAYRDTGPRRTAS